ncbi:SUMF1/EgtB/PvdO family nonheme iron enzyme [Maribacter antarcticus]|uniref:SUMF1/EgtB/PvdO family nonheme iron enzyme n=1 Tax=Maribacter antarcticus TaxID=505250 RepID=UPI00047E1456|nr:SUMF1/EgtB/PvdO family nonheme iron enzyme [Maribacter antarcticus]
MCNIAGAIVQSRTFVNKNDYKTEVLKEGNKVPWVCEVKIREFETKFGYNWKNAFKKNTIARLPEITTNDQYPVVNITWLDCIVYTKWVSKKNRIKFHVTYRSKMGIYCNRKG